jgi:hypothetical protein
MLAVMMALLVSISTVAMLYGSWRHSQRSWLALAGWALAILSLLLWSRALGPEFGISYAVMVFVCLVWLVVWMAGQTGSSANPSPQRPFRSLTTPGSASLIQHGSLFLLSVPASGLLSLLLSVALVNLLPWSLLTKVAIAVFAFPILWGLLSSWVCSQQSATRPALALGGLGLLGSLLIMV